MLHHHVECGHKCSLLETNGMERRDIFSGLSFFNIISPSVWKILFFYHIWIISQHNQLTFKLACSLVASSQSKIEYKAIKKIIKEYSVCLMVEIVIVNDPPPPYCGHARLKTAGFFFFFFKSLACFLRVSVVTDSCGARILYSAVKNPHNPFIVRPCLTRWIINHKNGSKYHWLWGELLIQFRLHGDQTISVCWS